MTDKMRLDNSSPNPKQKLAIILLARGHTICYVAKNIDVSQSTIFNWKTDPDFVEDIADETRFYVDEIRTRASSFVFPALERLRDLIEDEDPNIALKAIDRVLKVTGNDAFVPENYMYRHIGLETEYSNELSRSK